MIVVQCCELACFEDLTLLQEDSEEPDFGASDSDASVQKAGSARFNQMRFWLAVMPRLLLWTIGTGSEHDMAGQTKKRQRGFETRGQQKML